ACRLRPPRCPPLFPYTTLFRSDLLPSQTALASQSRQVLVVLLIAHLDVLPPGLRPAGPGGSPRRRDAARPGAIGHSSGPASIDRSEEHTSELQSRENLVCRLLL